MFYVVRETTNWANNGNGYTVKAVARSTSERTAKAHARNLYKKVQQALTVVWGNSVDDAQEVAAKVFGRTMTEREALIPRG